MKKMTLTGMTLILLLATNAQAMVAPWYEVLRRIDAAVEEMAENHLKIEDADEAQISSILVNSMDSIVVGIKGQECLVAIESRIPQHGMIGTTTLTAKILNPAQDCVVVGHNLPIATYEKVSAKLDSAAKLAKMVKAVTISGKGKIKVISAK